MTDYSTYALGLDLSANNSVTDWDKLAGHVDFIISRCSAGTDYQDPTFAPNCQKAYDLDIPFGAYHYFHGDYYTQFPFPGSPEAMKRWPSLEADQQYQNIIKALQYKKIYMFAIDLEERYNEGVDPQWMSVGSKILAGRVADWLAINKPGVKLYIYSRLTYLEVSAPGVIDWGTNYDAWAAQWIYNPGLLYSTWDNLKNLYPKETAKPKWITNKAPRIWQWSGDYIHLPGIQGAVDVNLWLGTTDQMHEELGLVPGQNVPTPDPDPVGQKWKARFNVKVRSTPSLTGQRVAGLLKGDTITAQGYSFSDGYNWVKHDGGYTALDGLLEAVE